MMISRLSAALRTLHAWWTVAGQRRRLREFDDTMLKDLGLSRVDALREAGRRPWDAGSPGDATLVHRGPAPPAERCGRPGARPAAGCREPMSLC